MGTENHLKVCSTTTSMMPARAATGMYNPLQEAPKPDYLDFDKDGDKKEPMKKALKEKGMKKEEYINENDIEITKEDVMNYLVAEEYVDNEVSAEILYTHMSDDFLCEIEDAMIAGFSDQAE